MNESSDGSRATLGLGARAGVAWRRWGIASLVVLWVHAGMAAGTAYRWIDPATGVVVFSDSPPPEDWHARDLQRIEIPRPRTVPAFRPPPEAGGSVRQGSSESPAPPYARVWIASPPNDESIRDNAGNVTVQVGLAPGQLRPGDSVVLYLDGMPSVRAGRLQFELENVDRGTHTLQAVVVDRSGSTLVRSEPVTFTLHRYSRLFRQVPPEPVAPRSTRIGPPGK